jgi:hypothetical protein
VLVFVKLKASGSWVEMAKDNLEAIIVILSTLTNDELKRLESRIIAELNARALRGKIK